MRQAVSPALSALLSIFLSGCFLVNQTDRHKGVDPAGSRDPAAVAALGLPLSLEIMEALSDGQQLHVLAKVVSRTAWNPAAAAVRFVGLSNGETVREDVQPLTECLLTKERDVLVGEGGAVRLMEPNREYQLHMSIEQAGLTDFQLELLWGGEAEVFLRRAAKRGLEGLILSRVEVDTGAGACADSVCGVVFKVSAELENAGPGAVGSVTLGVGLVWQPDRPEKKGMQQRPQHEEMVRIRDLDLRAGRKQAVRFVFEKPVPVRAGGRYRPVVRIVEAS